MCGVAVALLTLAGHMSGRTRKGDKLLNQGQIAEAKGDWDAALEIYERAFEEDPSDTAYMIAVRKARFEAGQKHVDLGERARSAGKYDDALREFQRALIADPGSSIALQDIRETERMMQSSKAGVKPDETGLTESDRAKREQEERVDSMLAPPQLKPTNNVIPMLKMNNQPPKVLYETVGKLAGINVIFDSQYAAPSRNFNVDLNNVTIDQAFDYLATLTRTFWKPLNVSTIFVAEDNVTKRRDFEDDVVKVFYVKNATSVQEFQEIATAIRTVAEIRRVFTYNAQRAMIVRDTVDKVALAEKLVQDLDKPKSEVVVDVIVMSANSERTRDLAATIATAGTAGINVPITFNGTSTTTTQGTTTTGTPTTTSAGTIALSALGRLSSNQFSASLPGGLLQAMLADSRTKVLNKPQVRASDGQKVTLKIGSRIPYATGSFGSAIGGVGAGVSPLVSTQFNYADVGVNIDMTPQVHSADEVTLHIEVTVSSVQQYVQIGGISQPVIGQQANIADIRLREGEVNILGGLNQTQENSNLTILRTSARKGCGFDVVSGGELERVLTADGKAAKRVVFSGVGKTREELAAALKAGIMLFNVESESELWALAECACRLRKRAPVALRVNPTAPLSYCISPDRDMFQLDGQRLKPARKRYLLFYKPKGVITSHGDPPAATRSTNTWGKRTSG